MRSLLKSLLAAVSFLGAGIPSAGAQTVTTSIPIPAGQPIIAFLSGNAGYRRGNFVRFDRDTLVFVRTVASETLPAESRTGETFVKDTVRFRLAALDSVSIVRRSKPVGRGKAIKSLVPKGLVGGAFWGMVGGLGYGVASKNTSVGTGVARGGLWGAGVLGTVGFIIGAAFGTDGTWERVAWTITEAPPG